MLNFSKLCQKCIFLHCSKILRKISCKNEQYFTLVHAHKPIFFFAEQFRFFSSLRCFSFFSLFLFSLTSTPYILYIVSIFSNEKSWKGDHDQVQVYWPVLPPILHQKLITFFLISSVRLQSIVKMDGPVERSIQPVLVAYPKNLLTWKFVTSQVVEWTFLQIPE